MKHTRSLLKLIVLALVAACGLGSQAAQAPRPKLVVGIVVDQMRWDYLYYYQNLFTEQGGFNRMLAGGYSVANVMIPYVPTVTAAGHATAYTGATPALSGIAGNNYAINGVHVNSVQDNAAQGLGTTGKAGHSSPRNLLVSTIGDELRQATRMQSKVVGVALKDRGSILPAGRAANAAYWFDNDTRTFVSSDYYMQQLPQWVTKFNHDNGKAMKHDMWNTYRGIPITFAMARAAIEGERLGTAGNECDMLCLSVSSTDATAHTHGLRSPNADSTYQVLDAELGQFLSYLDNKVGQGNYLVFLTADHGGSNNKAYIRDHNLVGGGWATSTKQINEAIKAEYGIDKAIDNRHHYSMYVKEETARAAGMTLKQLKQIIIDKVEQDTAVYRCVDMDDLDSVTLPGDYKQRLANGYFPGRSGNLQVILKTGFFAVSKDNFTFTSHGTHNIDDTHIPLLFYGWHIAHGETFAPAYSTDIAPTVCALLHIQMPNACMGTPILPVLGE